MSKHTAGTYDVLKEIRKIRKKHYEETKNMSMEERKEFDCRLNEEFQKELSQIDISNGKYTFPFLHYPKTDKNVT
ncbi:MAG: hypothetical protein LBT09_09425 [Planctomycetaceae bacterium]|jgi:hypothetical protein|nr:hypothetical protein [Planctomycetaceae bacterium]